MTIFFPTHRGFQKGRLLITVDFSGKISMQILMDFIEELMTVFSRKPMKLFTWTPRENFERKASWYYQSKRYCLALVVLRGGGQCISPQGGALLRDQNRTITFGLIVVDTRKNLFPLCQSRISFERVFIFRYKTTSKKKKGKNVAA